MQLPGLIVPPLTPFTHDCEVDVAALKEGVEYVVEDCNAAMVVAAGVETQEYQYLNLDERKELIRHTIDFVDGRRPVAVGVSHASFRTAVTLAQYAEELGAEAVQVLAPLRPFGGEPTTAELVRYFEAVARETSLPIVLYLNPGPGANVPLSATITLAALDRVHFIKESSRDLARVSRLIVEIDHARHARYFTTMQMLLITLQLGGSGATLPPPAAKLADLVIKAHLAGDAREAARLQQQFALYPARWMSYGLMPTMKASLEYLGIPAGEPYPPYQPIQGGALSELHAYLGTTDLMKE